MFNELRSLFGQSIPTAVCSSVLAILVSLGLAAFSLSTSWQWVAERADVMTSQNEIGITGVWSDACPCKVPCPCWAKRSANVKRCVNVQIFSLSGQVRGQAFKHSTLVLINLPTQAFNPPQPNLLYMDFGTSPEVRAVLSSLFTDEFKLAPAAGVRLAAIQSRLSLDTQSVTIPGVLEYEVFAPTAATKRQPNSDLRTHLYAWLQDPEQWLVRKLRLTLDSEKSSYEGTNSIVAKVVYSGQIGRARDMAGKMPVLEGGRVGSGPRNEPDQKQGFACIHPVEVDSKQRGWK